MGKKDFEKKVWQFILVAALAVVFAFNAAAQSSDPGHLLNQIEQANCTIPGIDYFLQGFGGPANPACKEIKTAEAKCNGQVDGKGGKFEYMNGLGECRDIRVDWEAGNINHYDHYVAGEGGPSNSWGIKPVGEPSEPVHNSNLEFGLIDCPSASIDGVLQKDNLGLIWHCGQPSPWTWTGNNIYFQNLTNGRVTFGGGTGGRFALNVWGTLKADSFTSVDSAGTPQAAMEKVIGSARGGKLELKDSSGATGGAIIKGYDSGGFQAAFLAGRIGIGTTTPSELLEVSKSQALGGATPFNFTRISINNPNPLGGTNLKLKEGADTRAFARYKNDVDQFEIGATETGAPMIFYTANTEKVRITPDGKVGIGIAIPLQDLHIYDETDPAIVLEVPPPVDVCGDGACSGSENSTTCPADCGGGGIGNDLKGASEGLENIALLAGQKNNGITANLQSISTPGWYLGIDALNTNSLKIGKGSNPLDAYPIVALNSSPPARLALGKPNDDAEILLEAMAGDGGKITLKEGIQTGAVIRGYSFNGTQAYFLKGNIGIGTQDAKQELDIQSISGNPGIVLESSEPGADYWHIGPDVLPPGNNELMIGTGTNISQNNIMAIGTDRVSIFGNGIGAFGGKLSIENDDTLADRHAIYVVNNEISTTEPNISYGLYTEGVGEGISIMDVAENNCYENGSRGSCILNDYAEMMEFSQEPKDGQLIIIDTDNPGLLKVSTIPFDPLIAGVASENPAMVIGSYGISIKGWEKTKQDGYYTYPLAIAGRKIIQTTSENGKIVAGDLLVTSSTRGKAMKCEIKKILEADDFKALKEKKINNERCRSAGFARAMGDEANGRVLALLTVQ